MASYAVLERADSCDMVDARGLNKFYLAASRNTLPRGEPPQSLGMEEATQMPSINHLSPRSMSHATSWIPSTCRAQKKIQKNRQFRTPPILWATIQRLAGHVLRRRGPWRTGRPRHAKNCDELRSACR